MHFIEVWLLFLAVFFVGCGLGALLHTGLASGPLAVAQDTVANVVGDILDRLKWRLGLAPDWRPGFRRSIEWPAFDRETAPAIGLAGRTSSVAEEGWSNDEPRQPDDDAWVSEADWHDDRVAEDAYNREPNAVSEETAFAERSANVPAIAETEMMRPAGLAEPRAGVPDNLQRIWGIGKRNEALLHSLGIYHFGQIAAWTPAEARWVASRLAFPERLERDNWIGQAIVLATGGDPSTVSPSNRIKKPSEDRS